MTAKTAEQISVMPHWTDINGNPIQGLREYAPGRWTAMRSPSEVKVFLQRKRESDRLFEEQLRRDFGTTYDARFECPRCADSKFISVAGKATPCPVCVMPTEEFEEANSAAIMGIFPEHIHSRMSNFDGDELVIEMTKWAAHWPPETVNIVFVGDAGNGKTHMSVALLREVSERHGRYGLFVKVTPLLERLRAASSDTATERVDQIMAPLLATSLLVLDDIGKGNWTAFAEEKMWLVIDHRYSKRLPTIVSANTDSLARLSGPTRDRLMDSRISRTVKFGGRNRRHAA